MLRSLLSTSKTKLPPPMSGWMVTLGKLSLFVWVIARSPSIPKCALNI